VVEVGQDVVSAAVQGPPEGGELVEPGGQPGAEAVDRGGEQRPAARGVLVGVGGDASVCVNPFGTVAGVRRRRWS
jgi:hypothetical protein